MPIVFLVPVVLVRQFSVAEFGQYKQLFVLFNMALPLIDFGITQSLIYFAPKYPDKQRECISQLVSCQVIICLVSLLLFFIFQDEIAKLLTNSTDIGQFIPYIGLLLVTWSVSNNLEILLSANKKSLYASIFLFTSELLRGVAIIFTAYVFGGLKAVLIGILAIGCIRLFWFMAYLKKEKSFSFFFFNKKLLLELLAYSVPLGAATLVNSLIEYTHQVIISYQLSAEDFAIYSIGCFQVPIIGMVSMSVSRVAIVKISEYTVSDAQSKIVEVLSNSFRKLSLIFFPVFVLLWTLAPEIVVLLYTDAYIASIPIFRAFIWILPIAAILVEYAPRAIGDAKYSFKVNCITLLLNVVYVVTFLYFFGIVGAAIGFVLSRATRKFLILLYLRKNLGTGIAKILHLKTLSKIFVFSIIALFPGLAFHHFVKLDPLGFLIIQGILYSITCSVIFWVTGIITREEKTRCRETVYTFLRKTPLLNKDS